MKLAYWKRYDRLLKNFSGVSLYKLVLEFAHRLPEPFKRKGKTGRGEKLFPREYSAYIAFMILMKGATWRQMELESDLYLGKHIDHSTFGINFDKISVEYFLSFIEETGAYLDRLLKYSDQYAIDSTAVTSPLKFETEIRGQSVKEKIEFRSHIIGSIHLDDHCVRVRKALSTDKRVADCEGAKRMIIGGDVERITLHGDRGYDFNRVYDACEEKKISPNIRPRRHLLGVNNPRIFGILGYNNETRKRYRGIIETVFGGLTNAGLLITRLKKTSRIIAYGAIILLRNNILNIARLK